MTSIISVNTIRATSFDFRINPVAGDALRLDSSGRAFRPNLPYFVATRSGQGDEGGGGWMTFPTILANRGGWYSGSGIATAPATGLYAFWCKTLTPSDGQIVDLRWGINDSINDNYGAGYSGNIGGHKTMEAFAVFALNKNDTVRVNNINSGTRCCSVHNTFMGYLVGG